MSDPEKTWYHDPYRLFIVLGLSTIVLLTIGSAVYTESTGDHDSRLPIFVGGGAVSAFLLIILAIWWVQILAGGRTEIRQLRELASSQPPPLSALKSWNTLYQHMVYYGGVPDILESETVRNQRKLVEWYAWANLLVLFPIINLCSTCWAVYPKNAFWIMCRPYWLVDHTDVAAHLYAVGQALRIAWSRDGASGWISITSTIYSITSICLGAATIGRVAAILPGFQLGCFQVSSPR